MTKPKVSMPKAAIFLLVSAVFSILQSFYTMFSFIESYHGRLSITDFTPIEFFENIIRMMESEYGRSIIWNNCGIPIISATIAIAFAIILLMKKRNRALFIVTCVYAVIPFF